MSGIRSWLSPVGIHSSTHELPLYENSPPTSPPQRGLSLYEPRTRASSSLSPYRRTDSPRDNRVNLAESIHTATVRLQDARETPAELLALERKAIDLQERLQNLVNAQSEALLAVNSLQPPQESHPQLDAFPDYLDDDASSTTGTAWSTTSSRSPAGHDRLFHSRHPSRKPKSLQSTRHDIYKTMLRLSRLKSREHDLLTPQLSAHTSNLHRIDRWHHQKARIARAASEVHASPDGRRAAELGQEVDRVDREIEELQGRLNQLRTHRDRLDHERQKSLNRAEAQQARLRREELHVDAEVRAFLSRAPDGVVDGPSSQSRAQWWTRNESDIRDGPAAVWSMKPERRTLEMAKDYWEWRLEGSERRVKDAEREEGALREGAQVWRQVVEKVNAFERSLKESLGAIAVSSQGTMDKEKVSSGVETIRTSMTEAATYLEEKHELSIEKGWNLLIACVGAELEAFRQAQEVLEDTLQMILQTELSNLSPRPHGHARRRSKLSSLTASEASTATIAPAKPPRAASPCNDNDDGDDSDPDPDLLISHLDTDPE